MIIGIDGNEANVREQVGVSVYTSQLLHYFQMKASAETKFIVYLRNQPLEFLPKETDYFRYQVVNGFFLWSQIFLPFHLWLKKSVNVFFAPAHYVPRNCPVPLVVTIHDLSYFYYPDEFLKKDLYKLQNWTKQSVEKANKVIAVSKTTKKDIIKYYNIPDAKIEVIYNGFQNYQSPKNSKVIGNWKLEVDNYILYVGTLQPRKNIITLIKAFSKFKKSNKDYKLVLVGKKGWLYEEIFDQINNLGIEKDVIFTGYVSNDEKAWLYKNAFCFVLPSLYEGFGIPILEAMVYCCPVITTYSSSLPEIGGEACLYFEPTNPDDLEYNINLLLNDSVLRKELISKGKERIKLFSWEKCAEETLHTIKNYNN